MLQISTKSTAQFLSNICFKNGTPKRKFPIWESRLSSSYTKTSWSVTVCAQSGHCLHGHMRVVEHATVELPGQWCSGRSNATTRWDAVSSGRHRESCYGRRVAGARPTPHSPWDLGQGYWAATATMRWIVLRDKNSTVSQKCKHYVILVTLRAASELIGIFHIGNFCFWVPFLKQLLLRNYAVDFVEICNVYVGKMIIKAAKRIFNSDKICRSYSDLNFGVTFLEHSVYYTVHVTAAVFC